MLDHLWAEPRGRSNPGALLLQVFVWIGKDANEVEKTESVRSGELFEKCNSFSTGRDFAAYAYSGMKCSGVKSVTS